MILKNPSHTTAGTQSSLDPDRKITFKILKDLRAGSEFKGLFLTLGNFSECTEPVTLAFTLRKK